MELALPTERRQLVRKVLQIIEDCRASAGDRANYYRQINQIVENGRTDGTRSIVNLLYRHHDKLAAHLYSPGDLRFTMDFEEDYDLRTLARGQKAGKVITRDWARTNTDIEFAQGVFEALKFGACVIKQWPRLEGKDRIVYDRSLVMPWQFAVYNEHINELDKQPAMVETQTLTLPEVWRRIWHLPEAMKLYERIKTHAKKGEAFDEVGSFFHQILSTSQIQTGVTGTARAVPGGIVSLSSEPGSSIVSPKAVVDTVKLHEIWLWGPTDYETIQLVEPDVLVAPRYKRGNLLAAGADSGLHPYSLIQPNVVKGYMFGRPEVVDLMEPQNWLSDSVDDAKRLLRVQIEKLLGFVGYDGLTDEVYAQRLLAGYFNLPQGAEVNDLTPKFPEQLLAIIELVIKFMDMISGFEGALSGRGEPGVRSREHFQGMLKVGSPTLRDRSLLVERQCATAGDLRLSLREIKDDKNYWTDPAKPEETAFKLADLPDDGHISVDSHSSSPIFSDDHLQQVAFGVKAGFVDPHSAIDLSSLPQKEVLHQRLREKEQQQAALMQQLLQKDPEALEKLLAKRRR